jgi:hypothetical protein
VIYSAWLKSRNAKSIGVVHGGAAEAIAAETAEVWNRPFVLLVTTTAAAAWSARMSMRQGPKIELRISRGLNQNLLDLAQRPPTAVFMHADMFRRDLVTEVRRISQAMHAIAGYDTQGPVIETLLFSRVTAMLETFYARQLGPLVIHDDATFIPDTALVAADRFSAGPAAQIDLGAIPGVLRAPDALAPDAVIRHAEFLARSDLATLLMMHEFLIGTRFGAAFDHWRTCLRSVAHTPGYELFVQLGVERLDELEKAMTPAAI